MKYNKIFCRHNAVFLYVKVGGMQGCCKSQYCPRRREISLLPPVKNSPTLSKHNNTKFSDIMKNKTSSGIAVLKIVSKETVKYTGSSRQKSQSAVAGFGL